LLLSIGDHGPRHDITYHVFNYLGGRRGSKTVRQKIVQMEVQRNGASLKRESASKETTPRKEKGEVRKKRLRKLKQRKRRGTKKMLKKLTLAFKICQKRLRGGPRKKTCEETQKKEEDPAAEKRMETASESIMDSSMRNPLKGSSSERQKGNRTDLGRCPGLKAEAACAAKTSRAWEKRAHWGGRGNLIC